MEVESASEKVLQRPAPYDKEN